jgi:hypothetical protein
VAIVAAIAAMTMAGCSVDDPSGLDRTVRIGGQSITVGMAPSDVATDGGNLAYVTDPRLDAVLVLRLRPQLEITRRVHVPGGPYAVEIDREHRRLLVKTARGVVQLTADARPRPLPSRRTAAR